MSLSTMADVLLDGTIAAACLTVGALTGRLLGCSQCRAVRDQEATLVRRLLGDRELQPLQRHRLHRHRPYTAAETLELLNVNGALLTPKRWEEIEDMHRRLGLRELTAGRRADEYEDDYDELPVPR